MIVVGSFFYRLRGSVPHAISERSTPFMPSHTPPNETYPLFPPPPYPGSRARAHATITPQLIRIRSETREIRWGKMGPGAAAAQEYLVGLPKRSWGYQA